MSNSSHTSRPPRDRARRTFLAVLGFAIARWRAYPRLLAWTLGGVLVATLTDVLTPLLAGRLVDDVSHGAGDATRDAAWMVAGLAALGLAGVMGRRASYKGITHLNARVMESIVTSAFARVQRFSSEWHANNFAGSTVRQITRGTWAMDTLGDTIMLLLVPEALVLVATTLVLGLHWLVMGLLLAVGSVGLVALSVTLTLQYVAPASRLANTWDTRMGAALADAVTCNAVVKASGAEQREDAHLSWIVGRWRRRTVRSWLRGTNSANLQALAAMAMRIGMIAAVVALWARGRANAGDVAYVLTMMFVVQGYLRDIGQQISIVQRSVNEMDELVALFACPPGVRDRPGAGAMRVTRGHIRFEHVTFGYAGQGGAPLFSGLDLDIPAGSRVGLVGPSGSGKTTLTKLL